MKKSVTRDNSKWNLAIICLVLTFGLMNCEDQDSAAIDDEFATNQYVIEQNDTAYLYKGKLYSEDDWSEKSSGREWMIGLGNVIYVFDTENQVSEFEKGDFQQILKNYTAKVENEDVHAVSKAVGDIIYGTAVYRLTLYKDKNFSGSTYVFYNAQKIGHKQTWIGYEWVNDKLERDLPSDFRKVTTSYKMEYLTVPKIDGYWMVMEMKLRTGLLGADRNVTWTKKLYKNPEMGTSNTVESDSDFSNNRIWAQLGIGTWNDHIQSFQISFNSY